MTAIGVTITWTSSRRRLRKVRQDSSASPGGIKRGTGQLSRDTGGGVIPYFCNGSRQTAARTEEGGNFMDMPIRREAKSGSRKTGSRPIDTSWPSAKADD
jgi:hypothetical protein